MAEWIEITSEKFYELVDAEECEDNIKHKLRYDVSTEQVINTYFKR